MNFDRKCPISITECSKFSRSDNKYVIFKKLEKVGEPYAYTSTTDKIYNVLMQQYKVNYDKIIPFVIGHFFINNYQDNIIAIEIKQTKEDMEEKRLNLKPFDLEAAKAGKPVYTRDGRKARIICFDAKGTFPIIALIDEKVEEFVLSYTADGKYSGEIAICNKDLIMLSEEHYGWVNIHKDPNNETYWITPMIFSTTQEAKIKDKTGCIVDTIRIQWND